MKKVFVLVITIFILTGCSFSIGVDGEQENSTKEKRDLSLQVTKVDQEGGVELDNSPIYQEIDRMITENPKIGAANDFSVFTVDLYQTESTQSLMLLGINRLSTDINNVSFKFTLGEENGEYIWQDKPILLSESEMGTFQQDAALPFQLELTEEQAEQLINMNQEDLVLEITDFEFKEVK